MPQQVAFLHLHKLTDSQNPFNCAVLLADVQKRLGYKKAQGSGGLVAMMSEGLWILSCYRGQNSHLLPPLLPARKLNRSDGNMAGTMMVENRPLKVGHTLTVTGFPKADAERFMINIHSGDDIAFHMSVWLNTTSVRYKDLVVYNTRQGGCWGEEIHKGLFPFKQKELFKVSVCLTREEFLVILSDGSEVHFPNRLGATEYNDFSFEKGVLIRSFEIN
ncbi:unnamed protein product [Arctogadus glacialis]